MLSIKNFSLNQKFNKHRCAIMVLFVNFLQLDLKG